MTQNLHTAYKMYLKAAKLRHVAAQFNVGICYKRGEGVEQSCEKAAKWYLASAKQGYASAAPPRPPLSGRKGR